MATVENEDDEATASPKMSMEKVAEADNTMEGETHRKRGGVKKKKRKGAVGTVSASKRVRDLDKQLKKFGDSMPPSVRKAKEAELTSMRALTAERTRRTKELETKKKYRMVKFFDRKKIERRLKSDDEEVRLQAARDFRYVTEYPRGEKYVSLYPKDGHTEESKRKVEEMRRRIENAADGQPAMDEVEEQEQGNEDDFFLQD